MSEGIKLASIQAAEKKLLLNTYERNPVLFVEGSGVYLRDEQGTEYLDLLSGIGVSALGLRQRSMRRASVCCIPRTFSSTSTPQSLRCA
jgi:acetylornithine/N-succinyldiaminopimelate aminotransferase